VDKLGCFVFADGDRYDGHFRRGAMHGYGVYYWANDRSTYFGKWDENSQQGCGVKFYGSGAMEYGEWKRDQYLGSYTGVCGRTESYGAMNNAIDVAQRARMFKYKPDSEVTLQKRPFTMHQDPLVYQAGTEWQMPGWRGEQYPAPTAEELQREHPRLYAQMQRHNEIWERAWRYYNLDLKDASKFSAEKRIKDAEVAEAEALAKAAAPEAADDYDEYGDLDDDRDAKKKKKKGKKASGKKKDGNAFASLTLSVRSAANAMHGAFENASRAASRMPEIVAAAEKRMRARAERERNARRAPPFASLSLSTPFGR
jgi:hypothetical protein